MLSGSLCKSVFSRNSPPSLPKSFQEYHSSWCCTELLVILLTFGLIKQTGILH